MTKYRNQVTKQAIQFTVLNYMFQKLFSFTSYIYILHYKPVTQLIQVDNLVTFPSLIRQNFLLLVKRASQRGYGDNGLIKLISLPY